MLGWEVGGWGGGAGIQQGGVMEKTGRGCLQETEEASGKETAFRCVKIEKQVGGGGGGWRGGQSR